MKRILPIATLILLGAVLLTGQSAVATPADTIVAAATRGFYVDPSSNPATWAASHPTDGRAADIRSAIAQQPMARWFGDWTTAVGTAVGGYVGAAANAGKIPLLVAYDIPHRDACGGLSSGGAASASAYRTWIAAFADSVKDRPAVVVLEPDALADFSCLTSAQITEREQLLAFAAQQFHDRAVNAAVYLDAGNSHYAAASDIATRLIASGIGQVRGFSLNVSNYHPTAEESTYAGTVNTALAARGSARKPFVVDTSRNGKGATGDWCNPPGRQLGGTSKVLSTSGTGLEAQLWVKTPGNSDGECGSAPTTPAGTFDPQLAYDLVHGY